MHRAVLENMQKRRSVRQFNGRDLSEADIRTVLQAASRPPARVAPRPPPRIFNTVRRLTCRWPCSPAPRVVVPEAATRAAETILTDAGWTGTAPFVATSANPSPTGITPGLPPPGDEAVSKAPEQSENEITIDGVAPSAAGFENRPSVACVAASSVATSERATAA